jgi:AraC family transcriptional regulator
MAIGNCSRAQQCSNGNLNRIERTIEFSRGLVEIRHYDWQSGELDRGRPDMYVFGLHLSRSNTKPHSSLYAPAANARSFQSGPVTLVPPGRQVPRNVSVGRQRSLFCLIEAAAINDCLPHPPQWDKDRSCRALQLDRLEFERVLRQIHQEAREVRFGSTTMIESLANMLCIELIRRLTAPASDVSRTGGLAPWRLRLLNERIYGDVAMPSLVELAELCGLTVRHLCRAFKAETGQTVGQHIDAAMAQHARGMLSETSQSLSDIAHRLGFATSSSFSNAFQRATGFKPGEIERPARQPCL